MKDKIKVGTKLIAISTNAFYGKNSLIVGKEYSVKNTSDSRFEIKSEVYPYHTFSFDEADKFFQLAHHDKHSIYLDLRPLNADALREIVEVLEDAGEKIWSGTKEKLKKDQLMHDTHLDYDGEEWISGDIEQLDSTIEVTFSQFKEMFSAKSEAEPELSVFDKIREWGEARNFYGKGGATIQSQFVKLAEEMGELAGNIARGKDVTDDLGDMSVVLTHMAALSGTTIEKCIEHSYNEIKDRKGEFRDGSFIKESDL